MCKYIMDNTLADWWLRLLPVNLPALHHRVFCVTWFYAHQLLNLLHWLDDTHKSLETHLKTETTYDHQLLPSDSWTGWYYQSLETCLETTYNHQLLPSLTHRMMSLCKWQILPSLTYSILGMGMALGIQGQHGYLWSSG